jgi:hypothetical protein
MTQRSWAWPGASLLCASDVQIAADCCCSRPSTGHELVHAWGHRLGPILECVLSLWGEPLSCPRVASTDQVGAFTVGGLACTPACARPGASSGCAAPSPCDRTSRAHQTPLRAAAGVKLGSATGRPRQARL